MVGKLPMVGKYQWWVPNTSYGQIDKERIMCDVECVSHPKASEIMWTFDEEMWRDWVMPIATLVFQAVRLPQCVDTRSFGPFTKALSPL